MSTHITLDDGRVLLTSNGAFGAILELAATELDRRPHSLAGFSDWLLDQRCEVKGPGVGYLDLRELAPRAAREFREAFAAGHQAGDFTATPKLLRAEFSQLLAMWESIARGEPPEALTSPHSLIAPPSGSRRGPGW